MEQKSTLLKEQIVGVWRNGDYWVSFADDGFMCGYLSDKCITEGDYIIDKDTIKAESSMLYFCTKFLLTKIDNKVLDCTVTYYEFGRSPRDGEEKTSQFTFTKTDDLPCKKQNELVGKKFQYDTDVVVFNFEHQYTLQGVAKCDITTYFYIIRQIIANMKAVENIQDYYVYNPPYIYYHEMYINDYNRSEDIINIRKVLIDDNNIEISRP